MVATSLDNGTSRANPQGTADSINWSARSRGEASLDSELVRRFNEGDEEAFIEIVARYRKKMLSVALRYLRNYADAEEIAQDTFVRAHRGLARFRGDSSLSTWLHKIAFNLARNRLKHHIARRVHLTYSLDCALNDDTRGTFSDLIACEAPGPSRAASAREFSDLVADCMAQLNAQQRNVLVLRNGLSRPYGEIARKLGVNVGTVKSRIARARESLRQLIAESQPDFEPDTPLSQWFEPVRSEGTLAIVSSA